MLSKSTDPEDLHDPFWANYWMEPKLDGMRAAVLKVGNEVTIYGRSWIEYQDHVPHLVEAFKAIPLDFHLDGELCYINGFGKVENFPDLSVPIVDFNRTMRVMGSNPDVAVEKQIENGYISFVAFDTIEMNVTYENRAIDLNNLPELTQSRFIHRIPVFDDWTPILYNQLVELGCEGAMLKNRHSFYKSGRPNKTMYKIKKEETYDVVVYEAYEGTGKHTGRLGGLKFGAYLPDGQFKKVGRAGGGFNDEQRQYIWDNKDSILGKVMEIKCNETVGSGEYRTPRHPQFITWRYDKKAEECLMEQFKSD